MGVGMDYRNLLRDKLAKRIAANPRYSLRAFARDLEIAPSRLSEILSGKQGLSLTKATLIADRLKLDDADRTLLQDSVEWLHSKSTAKRKAAELRLRSRTPNPDYEVMSNDSFRAIADWYHLAIIQLIEIENFKPTVAAIAKALAISKNEATDAVARLKRLGLLSEEKGKLVATSGFIAVSDGTSSESIRKFHRQILKKASAALECQTVADRDHSAVMITIARNDLDMAREMIRTFRRSLTDALSAADRKDSLYCLAIQFFDLTKNEEPTD